MSNPGAVPMICRWRSSSTLTKLASSSAMACEIAASATNRRSTTSALFSYCEFSHKRDNGAQTSSIFESSTRLKSFRRGQDSQFP